jgi:hypothetical protein
MNLPEKSLAASQSVKPSESSIRAEATDSYSRRNRVTVEDLLRLKRAEQPPAEFWTQFDHELRAKQLAALVSRRPWWTSWVQGFGIISRHPVAVGSLAALALAYAGFRQYSGVASPSLESVQSEGPSVAISHDVPAAVVSQLPAAPDAVAEVRSARPASVPARAEANTAVYSLDLARVDGVAVRMDARSLALGADGQVTESPSAKWIAMNLAAARAQEPEVTRNMLGLSRNLDAQIVPAAQSRSEPLEQMISPASERRSRLLGEALPMAAGLSESAVPIRDRTMSGLSEDRLNQSMSRYSPGADTFSIKLKF